MIRSLKVVMIIWAAVGILVGLAYIFFPEPLGEMLGIEKGPALVEYLLALLGVCYIATGAFVIAAAVRGPLKHITWVQFAIAMSILIVVVTTTSIARGLVTFSQEAGQLIPNAIFAVLFLAFYPWRTKPSR